jgi:hypothetical protein
MSSYAAVVAGAPAKSASLATPDGKEYVRSETVTAPLAKLKPCVGTCRMFLNGQCVKCGNYEAEQSSEIVKARLSAQGRLEEPIRVTTSRNGNSFIPSTVDEPKGDESSKSDGEKPSGVSGAGDASDNVAPPFDGALHAQPEGPSMDVTCEPEIWPKKTYMDSIKAWFVPTPMSEETKAKFVKAGKKFNQAVAYGGVKKVLEDFAADVKKQPLQRKVAVVLGVSGVTVGIVYCVYHKYHEPKAVKEALKASDYAMLSAVSALPVMFSTGFFAGIESAMKTTTLAKAVFSVMMGVDLIAGGILESIWDGIRGMVEHLVFVHDVTIRDITMLPEGGVIPSQEMENLLDQWRLSMKSGKKEFKLKAWEMKQLLCCTCPDVHVMTRVNDARSDIFDAYRKSAKNTFAERIRKMFGDFTAKVYSAPEVRVALLSCAATYVMVMLIRYRYAQPAERLAVIKEAEETGDNEALVALKALEKIVPTPPKKRTLEEIAVIAKRDVEASSGDEARRTKSGFKVRGASDYKIFMDRCGEVDKRIDNLQYQGKRLRSDVDLEFFEHMIDNMSEEEYKDFEKNFHKYVVDMSRDDDDYASGPSKGDDKRRRGELSGSMQKPTKASKKHWFNDREAKAPSKAPYVRKPCRYGASCRGCANCGQTAGSAVEKAAAYKAALSATNAVGSEGKEAVKANRVQPGVGSTFDYPQMKMGDDGKLVLLQKESRTGNVPFPHAQLVKSVVRFYTEDKSDSKLFNYQGSGVRVGSEVITAAHVLAEGLKVYATDNDGVPFNLTESSVCIDRKKDVAVFSAVQGKHVFGLPGVSCTGAMDGQCWLLSGHNGGVTFHGEIRGTAHTIWTEKGISGAPVFQLHSGNYCVVAIHLSGGDSTVNVSVAVNRLASSSVIGEMIAKFQTGSRGNVQSQYS